MNKKLKSLTVMAAVALVLFGMTLGAVSQQKMTLWHGYTQAPRQEAMKQAVAQFEKKNPGVEVKIEVIPWSRYTEKITLAIATGTIPDVAFARPKDIMALSGAGALTPLDGLIEKLGGPGAFIPALDQVAKYEGHYVLLPFYMHAKMLLYRKDWLKEAGMIVPEGWYELLHATRVLNDPPNHYGFVQFWGDYTGAGWLDVLFKVNKASYFDENFNFNFNTSEGREAIAFMVDLLKAGAPDEAMNYGDGDTYRILNTGKTAFMFETGFTVSVYYEEHGLEKGPQTLGAALVPRGRASRDESIYVAHIHSACKSKEADPKLSDDLLLTIYDTENYVKFLHTVPAAMVPVLHSVFNSDAWRANPRVKAMTDVLETQNIALAKGTHVGMGAKLNPYAYLHSTGPIRKMLQRIAIGDVSLEKAVAEAEQELAESLREVRGE